MAQARRRTKLLLSGQGLRYIHDRINRSDKCLWAPVDRSGCRPCHQLLGSFPGCKIYAFFLPGKPGFFGFRFASCLRLKDLFACCCCFALHTKHESFCLMLHMRLHRTYITPVQLVNFWHTTTLVNPLARSSLLLHLDILIGN